MSDSQSVFIPFEMNTTTGQQQNSTPAPTTTTGASAPAGAAPIDPVLNGGNASAAAVNNAAANPDAAKLLQATSQLDQENMRLRQQAEQERQRAEQAERLLEAAAKRAVAEGTPRYEEYIKDKPNLTEDEKKRLFNTFTSLDPKAMSTSNILWSDVQQKVAVAASAEAYKKELEKKDKQLEEKAKEAALLEQQLLQFKTTVDHISQNARTHIANTLASNIAPAPATTEKVAVAASADVPPSLNSMMRPMPNPSPAEMDILSNDGGFVKPGEVVASGTYGRQLPTHYMPPPEHPQLRDEAGNLKLGGMRTGAEPVFASIFDLKMNANPAASTHIAALRPDLFFLDERIYGNAAEPPAPK